MSCSDFDYTGLVWLNPLASAKKYMYVLDLPWPSHGSLNNRQKEVLSYFLRDLQAKSTDHDFCKDLIKKIIPLIEFLSSQIGYKVTIDNFSETKKELITKILPEVEALFVELQFNMSQGLSLI